MINYLIIEDMPDSIETIELAIEDFKFKSELQDVLKGSPKSIEKVDDLLSFLSNINIQKNLKIDLVFLDYELSDGCISPEILDKLNRCLEDPIIYLFSEKISDEMKILVQSKNDRMIPITKNSLETCEIIRDNLMKHFTGHFQNGYKFEFSNGFDVYESHLCAIYTIQKLIDVLHSESTFMTNRTSGSYSDYYVVIYKIGEELLFREIRVQSSKLKLSDFQDMIELDFEKGKGYVINKKLENDFLKVSIQNVSDKNICIKIKTVR